MSPASYLTAPPRVASAHSTSDLPRNHQRGGGECHAGDRVQHKVVAGGEHGHRHRERVERAGDACVTAAAVRHEAGADAERPPGVHRRKRRDGVRERSRAGRADVDPRETAERVLEPDPGEPRRRGRKAPVDGHRDRRREQEAVAKDAEAGPRAAVEPDEERGGEREVPREVERIERRDEAGDAQRSVLERRLPREVGGTFPAGDLACVAERERPVRPEHAAGELVRADRREHDRRLRGAVVTRDGLPHAGHGPILGTSRIRRCRRSPGPRWRSC
jgi:hypothetical protein